MKRRYAGLSLLGIRTSSGRRLCAADGRAQTACRFRGLSTRNHALNHAATDAGTRPIERLPNGPTGV